MSDASVVSSAKCKAEQIKWKRLKDFGGVTLTDYSHQTLPQYLNFVRSYLEVAVRVRDQVHCDRLIKELIKKLLSKY
eukprot:g53938.t1